MRNFIKRFFGFEQELQSKDEMIIFHRNRIVELESEIDELKTIIYREFGLVKQATDTPVIGTENFKPVKGIVSWKSMRNKLENRPAPDPVIVKEIHDEINSEVNA